MLHRHRLGITAVFFCHLLLVPRVVTSQLLPPPDDPSSQASQPATTENFETINSPGEEVTIRAREQEKAGDIFKLRGDVEIVYRSFVLRADEITYHSKTGEITASGHITLDGGAHDDHIEASHGSYNIRTQTGVFYDVVGTTGVRFRGPHVTLTSTNPFAFTGKKVEKTSPERYVVYHGSVTACELPRPKWTFTASKITVDVGGEARIYNSAFRVEKVPIFYFPYAQHPVDNLGRQTGFLVPTFGTSSRKGLILGESVYWAINRSADATLGAEYFSKRGWAQHGDFRWRPAEDSYLKVNYFGVMDRGFGFPPQDQGGEDATLNGEAHLPFGFRGVASVEYLSNFVFRLAFTESFSQTVNSEVKSDVFFSRTYRGFSFNGLFGRYQNFQSEQPGDVVTILHLPSFQFSSVDRQIGRSPLYWSFDSAVEGVSRKQPGFVTGDIVGRFDVHPRLSVPLRFHGWSFNPAVGARETFYGQRLLPDGSVADADVNRRAFETSVDVRPPALDRIFERQVLGRKIKHTIEPRLTYHFVTGVDNFSSIIRFDSRDILSNTNDVEYAITQRIYAKAVLPKPCEESTSVPGESPANPAPTPATCETPGAREVIAWELKEKYYFDETFGGALVNGKRNVFTATDNFTGIAFLTAPRHFSPIVSRIHVHPSLNTDVGWQLDYDTLRGRISASTVFVNVRVGEIFGGASHAYLLAPGEIAGTGSTAIPAPNKFSQYRLLLGYGNPNKRGLSAAVNVGFDANLGFLQYSAFQTTYNWDCCGLSFEYRRYALGSVRNENQYRFAFTLANIGTFGNMKRQERIF